MKRMRKIMALFLYFATILIFIMSFASADIIISQQPEKLYNIGDVIKIPVKIKTLINTRETFSMNLICNGAETEVYKSDIDLSSGEEQSLTPIIILYKNRINRPNTFCKIKALLNEDFALTDEFKISDKININISSEKRVFQPEEDIIIEGNAVKENGENVEGYVEISIANENLNLNILDTVTKGYFFVNFSLPKETKAGEYLINVKVYEKSGITKDITNQGSIQHSITITQVPTSLEIITENPDNEVNPGESLKVKAILHDQTGEKIDSDVFISIKNNESKILKQEEMKTGEILEFPIAYNEPPKEWRVYALSNKISSEIGVQIKEKSDVKVELINKTILITNIGNIPYNKSLLIKIGNASLVVNTTLGVDKTKKFSLSAPEGEYPIEVLSEDGQSKITGRVTLTGKTIAVKEASGALSLVRYPFVWAFIIGILGFVFFMVLKKGYKRSFIGYIHKKRAKRRSHQELNSVSANNEEIINKKSPINLKSKNKAELSLSLKGDRQDVSLICLKTKSLIESQKGKYPENVKETLQKIIHLAEEQKAFVYESQDNLFFIFAPTVTKSFKNEKTALKLSNEIIKILSYHNKLFKERIEYGLSLNYGAIIAKLESSRESPLRTLKFMSLGALISRAKKIASAGINKDEILLDENIKDKLTTELKAEKHVFNGTEFYTIKSLKHYSENKKFISEFVKRLERD